MLRTIDLNDKSRVSAEETLPFLGQDFREAFQGELRCLCSQMAGAAPD
jgi:hypothetical protein